MIRSILHDHITSVCNSYFLVAISSTYILVVANLPFSNLLVVISDLLHSTKGSPASNNGVVNRLSSLSFLVSKGYDMHSHRFIPSNNT